MGQRQPHARRVQAQGAVHRPARHVAHARVQPQGRRYWRLRLSLLQDPHESRNAVHHGPLDQLRLLRGAAVREAPEILDQKGGGSPLCPQLLTYNST